MSFKCEYCLKFFCSISSLNNHQKTARYCLSLRNIKSEEFICEFCKQNFYNKKEKERANLKLEAENDLLRKQIETLMSKNTEKECLLELQNKLQEIAMVAIEQKNETITGMVKKYAKKQSRVKYDEKNVFYILTTKLLKSENRYIFGKAKNLTSRLSTYNKTDEHEVVFYKECGSEEQMSNVENVVFQKLNKYREQANRERFILPQDQNIDFFIKKIEDVILFLNESLE
jgi:hypothetical protein